MKDMSVMIIMQARVVDAKYLEKFSNGCSYVCLARERRSLWSVLLWSGETCERQWVWRQFRKKGHKRDASSHPQTEVHMFVLHMRAVGCEGQSWSLITDCVRGRYCKRKKQKSDGRVIFTWKFTCLSWLKSRMWKVILYACETCVRDSEWCVRARGRKRCENLKVILWQKFMFRLCEAECVKCNLLYGVEACVKSLVQKQGSKARCLKLFLGEGSCLSCT